MTLDELAVATDEPNTHAMIAFLRGERAERLAKASIVPSMDALACHWARFHDGGVRVVTAESVRRILVAGDRALNLRVADPYLVKRVFPDLYDWCERRRLRLVNVVPFDEAQGRQACLKRIDE